MSGKIITIAQHKGGAGKTTLSAQLAAALSETGAQVLTVDVDPQGSLTEWHRAREISLGRKNRIAHKQVQGWRLMREARSYAAGFDYVVIDTPPHTESESSVAIRMADLVLMPIQPSPLDIWASAPTLKLILSEHRPLMLVLNRIPAKSRLNATIMEKLESMGINVSRQTIGNRVAFVSSIMTGLGAVEADPRGTAAEEIRGLVAEILKDQAAAQDRKSA